MKAAPYALFLFLCLVPVRTPPAAQPGAFNPSLLECGRHGEVEIICGTIAPEDFERTPDGRFLIVSKMGRGEVRGSCLEAGNASLGVHSCCDIVARGMA
jgi:hypothetical protein